MIPALLEPKFEEEAVFYETAMNVMQKLNNIRHNPGWNGAILLHVIYEKLDVITKKCWSMTIGFTPTRLPTLDAIMEFLLKHHQHAVRNYFTVQKSKIKCYYCAGPHTVYTCRRLFNLTVPNRWLALEMMTLCVNCIKKSHTSAQCWNHHCTLCNRYHNTRLHDDEQDLALAAAADTDGGTLARMHRENVARDHVNGVDYIPVAK